MYKYPTLRSHFSGICLGLVTVGLVACSEGGTTITGLDADNTVAESGSNESPGDGDNATTDNTTIDNSNDVDNSVSTSNENPDGGTTDTTNSGETTDSEGSNTPDTETGAENTDNPDTSVSGGEDTTTDGAEPSDSVESEFPPAIATGADVSGAEDDSPTETESASIAGPFIKDTSRPSGPPSVPEGLVMLMAAEDWVEFSWKPSTDDQSVEAYEVYRDNILVQTVQRAGGTNTEFDYRSWLSTSYQDCNFTRYTFCDENPILPGSSYEYRVVAVDNEGMKSAPSEPAIFQLAVRESGPADLTGYTQVFGEEFNGNSLDRSKWKTSLPWGPDKIINGESQYFVNTFGSDPLPVDPFVFTGSTLQITATNTPDELLEQANNQKYLSGVISTSDNFKMTYGYIEMSAKVAGGQGFLSTFYTFNQDYFKNQPEIDIIEYIGNRPDKAYQTYHYYDSNRARTSTGERHSSPTMETVASSDLSAGFHNYSVLWEPGLVVWYIDGEEVRRLVGIRVSDEPMNIIAQLVVGSEWIGEPDTALIPNTYEIDYIRAWQKQ